MSLFIRLSLSLLPLPISLLVSAQPDATIQFTDITKAAGITFTHFKGNNGTSAILEEAGPGVCVLDYDGDGYQDIYFVNGRDLYQRGLQKRNALYRNNSDGSFTDVTDKAGVGAMDFDAPFHSGATFFDYDHDGLLDLYVGSYVNFGPGSRRVCQIGAGVPTSCPPSVYQGTPAILYHNNGDGSFTNVTKAAKIYQPKGKNLSVGAFDFDNDGWPDLFVANDGVEAYLYRNNRNGTFTEAAMISGMALGSNGETMAAMCVSMGDYDNDGWLDLYISDYQDMPDRVWRNDGKGFLEEVSYEVGVGQATKNVLSFGGGFFDYDNDGWLDIFIANGHVYPEIELASPVRYKQINQLFRNNCAGKFVEVTRVSGDGFATPYAGRGAAFVDFDNDGNVDVVVSNNGDPPLLLRNGGASAHFLNFKLIGAKSNRDATGARVRVRAGGLTQMREISAGGSYFSHGDLRAHFGLGQNVRAESVEVSWPGGQRQAFRDVAADRFYVIEEGKSQLSPQRFSPPLRER